jgi:hypothetical protein
MVDLWMCLPLLVSSRTVVKSAFEPSNMTQEDFIWIITDDLPEQPITDRKKGNWGDEVQPRPSTTEGIKINASELEQKMTDFLRVVGRLFQQAERQAHLQAAGQNRLQLDEVELSAEISSEGEVKLVAGVKTAGKGAITLKFRRKELEG